MKKISVLVVVLGICLASFSQNEKALATNRKIYKAIETGDVSPIRDFIAKDAVDHESGAQGQDVIGSDSILASLANMHNGFTDLKFNIIADAVSGDYIFSLVHVTGTTKDSAAKKIDMTSMDVVKLKNGKAIEHWEYMDPKDVMAMMPQNK